MLRRSRRQLAGSSRQRGSLGTSCFLMPAFWLATGTCQTASVGSLFLTPVRDGVELAATPSPCASQHPRWGCLPAVDAMGGGSSGCFAPPVRGNIPTVPMPVRRAKRSPLKLGQP